MKSEITCPQCGSDHIAAILYGMPALTEELERKIEAGEVVLNGCEIVLGEPQYQFECQECGHRFDAMSVIRLSAEVYFSAEDYAFLQNLTKYADEDDYVPFTEDESLAIDCCYLARKLLNSEPRRFERLLESGYAEDHRFDSDPTFARLVKLGLEYGVAYGDGACANYLGALYYMGNIVEQDYAKAKELYELAEAKGIAQAVINLGYIYEYGRTAKADHQKAFNQYAKAAVLYDAPEAMYKLGDMYSRGKAVARDLRAAYCLYEKSLELADGDTVMQAQPAIRIAKLISDRDNAEWGIPYDPMRALELYQLAERGLRIDIAHGQTCYAKRLNEALGGQELMRAILEGREFRL